MRARPREVNIFNMSLLDILCGALGAFCFMMLVALPYYIAPGAGATPQQRQENIEELLKALDELRKRVTDPAAADELAEKLKELTDQMRQFQGDLNQKTNENDQLRKEKEDLAAKNDEQDRWIKQQKPFVVMTSAADLTQEVDLFVQDDLVT